MRIKMRNGNLTLMFFLAGIIIATLVLCTFATTPLLVTSGDMKVKNGLLNTQNNLLHTQLSVAKKEYDSLVVSLSEKQQKIELYEKIIKYQAHQKNPSHTRPTKSPQIVGI